MKNTFSVSEKKFAGIKAMATKGLIFSSRNLIVLLFIITPTYLMAQIPNSDFEEWAGGEPLYWITSNDPYCTPGAVNVTQTENAYSGNYAVRGEVINISGTNSDCLPGDYDLYARLSTWDYEVGGFPISKRPEKT